MNCLTVPREEVQGVGLELCASPLVRKVSFTGSTAVGKWLMRESAATVKKVRQLAIIVSYSVRRPSRAPLQQCVSG